MIKIIAAIDRNRGIGYKNELLVKLKKDMKYFRETTRGHKVVMGRKTYDSIGKPLPNRENIIITHSNISNVSNITCITLEEFLEKYNKESEIYVIGGASIYKEFLPYTDELLLTEIDEEYEADTYFPEYKRMFKEVSREVKEENGVHFAFVRYIRY